MSITLVPVDPAGAPVEVELDGFEQRSGDVGGWETLDRPRQDAAAGWVGHGAVTLTVPALVDGLADEPAGDRSIEATLAAITRLGRATSTTIPPAVLQIRGLASVTAVERWVIDGIDWGDYLTDPDGRRVWASLTLTFRLYLPPRLVQSPAAKVAVAQASAAPKKPAAKKTTKKKKKKKKKK